MADEKASVIETIKKYIDELAKNQIPILRVILFGSHAKGIAGPESDIDIALISEVFKGDRFEDRRRIVPFRRNIDSRIEPIPFKPEDFNNGGILAEEIKKTGVAIL
jgi:predicted nucleotidyltransferase